MPFLDVDAVLAICCATRCRPQAFPKAVEQAATFAISWFQVEEFAQLRLQPLGIQVADQAAILGHRDLPRLLRDNDRDGVRLLGDANGGAVAGAKLRCGIGVVRQGQDHAGGHDSPITHDGRAIVQGGVRVEEVDQ